MWIIVIQNPPKSNRKVSFAGYLPGRSATTDGKIIGYTTTLTWARTFTDRAEAVGFMLAREWRGPARVQKVELVGGRLRPVNEAAQ